MSRAQRSTSEAKWCTADPGSPTHRRLYGPGAAVHRFALHCIRDTRCPCGDASGLQFEWGAECMILDPQMARVIDITLNGRSRRLYLPLKGGGRLRSEATQSGGGLGCVKTLRGMTAPGILRLVVTFRAKKCRNLSSAQHYDQIRFRFYTA